jgi:P27 family predicted phage terminase small subunit
MNPKPAVPKPPKHLKAETRRWWASVVAGYVLEDHHVRLLTLAGEAWDRGVAAREALAKDGMFFTDSRGNPRSHPAMAVERDTRIAFARLLRELDLDVEPPRSSSRPPGRY